jgi:hypothetical protein
MNFCSPFVALRIHMSENAYKAISSFEEYVTAPRGETFVKVVFKHSTKRLIII